MKVSLFLSYFLPNGKLLATENNEKIKRLGTKYSLLQDHQFGAVLLEQACIIFNTALYHNTSGAVFVIPPDFRGDFSIIPSRVTVSARI